MSGAVEVWLSENDEARVGTLYSHLRRGVESATFAYDGAYLARPDAYSLDPQLPLTASSLHTPAGRAIFGALSDAAPDRWGRTLLVRREARLARDEARPARTLGEIDFLLGVRDDLRQGALRFRDRDGSYLADASGVPALTDLPELLDLADRAESDAVTLPDLRRLVQAGGSLGGARPKAHVRTPEGALAIAKFPSADRDTWDVMAWERVALALARRAGVEVMPSRLLSLAGRSVLMVERFDRLGPAGGERRVGYASAMTLLEVRDGDRASYLDIAAIVEERSDRTSEDLRQLWRRMVFGILIGNTDDHLRNHGFLHVADRDAWRLSPAFDLNPEPVAGPRHHATSVDGGDAPSSVGAALHVARDFRLGDDAARDVLAQVTRAVADWRAEAARAGIDGAAIERMAPAFDLVG